MKARDWTIIILLFSIGFLAKMCEGCVGCSGCSGSSSGPDIKQLKERVSRETGYEMHEFSISNIEFVHDDPPTYQFKIRGPYGISHEGRCSLSSEGNVRGISVD